ncbi:unnamed protein product [Bemisia tabaci]|uniref:Uncharacterized protein n=1 Tax=Bemisia tabaci TaxID=7038 RepID=A0A9P0F4B3_BEMTA|nr:unnamed protein product [Bemisia tabaci]
MNLTSGLAMAAVLICFVFLILSHASIANAAPIMTHGNRGSEDNACAERMMAEEFLIDLMNQTQPQLVEINEICEGCTIYKVERELPTMDNYDMVIKDGAMADGKVATHGDGPYDGKSEDSVGWGSTAVGR